MTPDQKYSDISVRDQIAAMAMVALFNGLKQKPELPNLAKASYQMADTLIAESSNTAE